LHLESVWSHAALVACAGAPPVTIRHAEKATILHNRTIPASFMSIPPFRGFCRLLGRRGLRPRIPSFQCSP